MMALIGPYPYSKMWRTRHIERRTSILRGRVCLSSMTPCRIESLLLLLLLLRSRKD